MPHAGGWASAPAADEAGAPVPTDVPYVKTGANWSVYYYHPLTECFIFSSSHLFIYVFTILSCRFSCILFFIYIYIYMYYGVYIYIYSKEIIISSLLLKHFMFFSSLAQTAHVLLLLLRLLAAAPCVPQADRRKRPRRRHHLLGQLRGGTVG